MTGIMMTPGFDPQDYKYPLTVTGVNCAGMSVSLWKPPTFGVKLLSPDGKLPTKSDSDAGYDLYASEDVTILPGSRGVVLTGISIELPEGVAGLIWPRSGMSVNSGVDVLAGVVDNGYRGEIKVCLLNTNSPFVYSPKDSNTGCAELGYVKPIYEDTVHIKKGDRIAQMVLQNTMTIPVVEIQEVSDTERGDSGFGSSGD